MQVAISAGQLAPIVEDFVEWLEREDTTVQGPYLEAVVSVKNILAAAASGQVVLATPERTEEPVAAAGPPPTDEVESD